MDILRLIQSAPAATKLLATLQRAQRGDAEAVAWLKSEGWAEALEIYQPGAGKMGKRILHHVREAKRNIEQTISGDAIEGDFREVPPWEPFIKRVLAQTHGGHIILGSVGTGKTMLALKLAQRYQQEHGYKVECVNMYGSDVPPFAVSISKETLIKRMTKLSEYLDGQNTEDDEDDEKRKPKSVSLPPVNRIIVIDEASLTMTHNANDPARRAAIQALTQCRHLSWVVLYIAQWAGQLPLQLFGQTTVWVKKPDGRESMTDRDNPAVRDLWERAGQAFNELCSSPWYQEPVLDYRAWAYCDAPSLNGARGYRGMVPFVMPDMAIEAEYRKIDDAHGT